MSLPSLSNEAANLTLCCGISLSSHVHVSVMNLMVCQIASAKIAPAKIGKGICSCMFTL